MCSTSWPTEKINAAAKYGLLGLNKSYAQAFAPTVRVNVFAPGFMETEANLAREDWKSGRGDQLRGLTPMGHIPSSEELAGAALFLASDDAAHLTGDYLVADGGYNMVGAGRSSTPGSATTSTASSWTASAPARRLRRVAPSTSCSTGAPVLTGLPLTARAYAEEVFGPVAPVVPFDDLDQAAQLASDTPYGLSLGILNGT